jgi:hypothetical protein
VSAKKALFRDRRFVRFEQKVNCQNDFPTGLRIDDAMAYRRLTDSD